MQLSSAVARLCMWEGNCSCDVTQAVHHRNTDVPVFTCRHDSFERKCIMYAFLAFASFQTKENMAYLALI